MKEPFDDRNARLLDAVFETERFLTREEEIKDLALTGLRRRRSVRRLAWASAVTGISTLAVCCVVVRFMPTSKQTPQIVSLAPSTKDVATADSSAALKLNMISDDELLSLFPPDSCFLAEVEGRKVLVFHDPAVRQKYFE